MEEYTKLVGHDCINGSRGERAIRAFTPRHSRVNGVAYTRKYNLSPLYNRDLPASYLLPPTSGLHRGRDTWLGVAGEPLAQVPPPF